MTVKKSPARIVAGVKLGLIALSPEWQARAAMDTEHLRELHDALKAGSTLPPLEVVELVDGYALVDGYHRHAAMLATSARTCDVRVVAKGDAETARWWSYAANRGHGLKRTNADKRRSVRDALGHAYAGDMSNDDLAEHCGVGLSLITDVRKELDAPSPKEAATARAEKATGGSVRERAAAAGVSKSAVQRADKRAAGVSPSLESSEGDTIAPNRERAAGGTGPTLAERQAAHDEAAKVVTRTLRDLGAYADRLPSYLTQDVAAKLKAVRASIELSSPVPCPTHDPIGCMICRGTGEIAEATAAQLGRAS